MSAEPTSTVTADGASAESPAAPGSRTPIDVRQFSWIRPLAGDYANNFQNVASLYAGDPQSPGAWRDAIERTQRHPRQRAEVAAVLSAQ